MFQYLKTENVFVALSLDVLENFLGMLKLNRVKNCCSYRFFRLVGDLDSATSVQLGCCICLFFFSLGFTPCKALQGMELQEIEAQKD